MWRKYNVVSFVYRKMLQRSGKDHSILLVLPSGVYHYKFIVDGEWRYIPDLPFVADELGSVCNLLDVNVSIFHAHGLASDLLNYIFLCLVLSF